MATGQRFAVALCAQSHSLTKCRFGEIKWFARQQNWPLDYVEVTVDHTKKLAAGASVPADVFDKVIFIRGSELTDEQRAHLIDVASKCPVQRILEGAPSLNTGVRTKLDEYSINDISIPAKQGMSLPRKQTAAIGRVTDMVEMIVDGRRVIRRRMRSGFFLTNLD